MKLPTFAVKREFDYEALCRFLPDVAREFPDTRTTVEALRLVMKLRAVKPYRDRENDGGAHPKGRAPAPGLEPGIRRSTAACSTN